MCKVLKYESEFSQIKRNNEVRLAKPCRECNLKKYEEKSGPCSQHTNTYELGKMAAKLQIRRSLLIIIRSIPVINI